MCAFIRLVIFVGFYDIIWCYICGFCYNLIKYMVWFDYVGVVWVLFGNRLYFICVYFVIIISVGVYDWFCIVSVKVLK